MKKHWVLSYPPSAQLRLIRLADPSFAVHSCHFVGFVMGWLVYLLIELTKRDVAGFAIGGLSGGEEKKQFWRMVDVSTDCLPTDKPRYLMGVG